MATYYVSTTGGSDANNGTSPATPFLTIAKAIGAAGVAVAGDTVYIAPGTYREQFSLGVTGSIGSVISVLADIEASHPGSGSSYPAGVVPGAVIWTVFTSNDYSNAAQNPNISLNGKAYMTFKRLLFIGGANNPTCISATGAETNFTFQDCYFQPSRGGTIVNITVNYNVIAAYTFDRCIFAPELGTGIAFTLTRGASGDYNMGNTIQNCLFLAQNIGVSFASTGVGANFGGGTNILNCTFMGTAAEAVYTTDASLSTTFPVNVYNSLMLQCSNFCLRATSTGQIIEDFNYLTVGTARTNVSVGVNSMDDGVNNSVPTGGLYHGLWEHIVGVPFKMLGTPAFGSPMLGFGKVSSPSAPTVDMVNKPRPGGKGSSGTTANDSGTSTGSNTTLTLKDTGKTWTTNAYTGYTAKLTGGTGSGQQRLISSNTGTVLTLRQAWTTTPDATSTYSIYQNSIDYAVGALENHDSAVQESSVIDASTYSAKIVGPGDLEDQLAVDAVSTTITVKLRYDSTYGTANSRPQVVLLDNAEIGVTIQTITATVAALNAWETQTITFTPTRAGVVTLRYVSQDSAGNGTMYIDTVSVS